MKKWFKILRKNSVSLTYCILLCTLPLIVSSSLGYAAIQYESELRSFTFLQWGVVFLITVFTMGFALTPTTFISLLSGYLLGWEAIPALICSYMGASLLCYSVAKKLDNGTFLDSLHEIDGVDRIIHGLKKEELKIVILSKLSPILPFAASNVLLSIGGASVPNFLLGSLIGMLPRTLAAIWVGRSAHTFQQVMEGNANNSLVTWLIGGLIVISVWGISIVFKRALNEKAQP
ncbi:VTT domain-containing protein [Limibacter armeniacum]|uniref:TVP38/TMEM64 family protein n=1 Tax=Limibacter armeniacum TaxID=466084 RepID=UPI002FE532DC